MNRENVAVSGLPVGPPSRKAPSAVLSIELGLYGDVALLRCRGRLVYRQDADELTSIVADLLAMTRRLVVDLEGVESVDSAGLGELVMLHVWAEGLGYDISFAGANARVRHLLELTNLSEVLEVHANLDQAVRAMTARAPRPASVAQASRWKR